MKTNTLPTQLPRLEKTITKEQIRSYAEVSGDFNPVHLSEEFAKTSYFGRLVAHGMMTLAFLAEMLAQAYGERWVENGSMKVRFKRPAYPGERLHTWGELIAQEVASTRISAKHNIALLTCDGNEQIISGTALVYLPVGRARHE